MLLDPTTFEALAEGLNGKPDDFKSAMDGMPAMPDDGPLTLNGLDRTQVLLSFGLTERDLDYMGDEQRAKVDEVINRVMTVHAFA